MKVRNSDSFLTNRHHLTMSTPDSAIGYAEVSQSPPRAPRSDSSDDEDRASQPDTPQEDTFLPNYFMSASRATSDGASPTEPVLDHAVLQYAQQDADEEGDGGDSDEECEDADIHHDAMLEAARDRLQAQAAFDDDADIVADNDENAVLLLRGQVRDGYTLRIPTTPPNWHPHPPKPDQPPFADVDNPGGWSEFTFQPTFHSSNKKYKNHVLPTGATPVPENQDGKRSVNGWDFHYRGWSGGGTNRSGASRENLFPESRKGRLDAAVLTKLGLTRERMEGKDALFFHQLLLPMCDPSKSGITGDPRRSFYAESVKFSNVYAMLELGLGTTYGHEFKVLDLPELVKFDGTVVRDGVRGGSGGALHRRWMRSSADYDPLVAGSLTYERWLQIKRTIKLCNNSTAPKRGDDGYDPAYKFDLIYDVLIANVNAITEFAELDQGGDETTFGHGGHGEAGSGLVGRIMGKPGVTKGGQTVIMSDVHRIRPRAYMHRHKLHPKPDGWNAMGPLEVRRIMEAITPLIIGEQSDGRKQIFRIKPHSTWDNYFSGCQIFNWMGEEGYETTMTTRRDRLPSGVRGDYFHKKGTNSNDRTKAARFLHPIVATRKVPASGNKKAYERVHCSFQSTSSCNIATVNALNTCDIYVRERSRGRGENKRHWAIEMNEARDLYLSTYSRIDSIDHLIKNCHMFYRSWKYWHAAMLHAKALAVVVAYDIYLEVAEGHLDSSWKVEHPMGFFEFREQLSLQMLRYNPTDRRYPGDSKMRVSTQQHSAQRQGGRTREQSCAVTPAEIMWAKSDERLCGDLTKLTEHATSMARLSHKRNRVCVVCGENCSEICTKCGKSVHGLGKKRKGPGSCFLDLHDDNFFGLAKCDMDESTRNHRKKDWTYPSDQTRQTNARHIKNLLRDIHNLIE